MGGGVMGKVILIAVALLVVYFVRPETFTDAKDLFTNGKAKIEQCADHGKEGWQTCASNPGGGNSTETADGASTPGNETGSGWS